MKAVDGISFKIQESETFSIVGESGCGKTTTTRAILKVEAPTAGAVLWRGTDLYETTDEENPRLSRRGPGPSSRIPSAP